MAAGNRAEDNAIVNDLSSALKSRLVTLRVESDLDQWIEDYAVPNDIDPRIIGYVKANPLALNDFNPDSKADAYSCPRSLEFLSRLIKNQKVKKSDIPLIAGTIGDVRAGEFYAACVLLDRCKVTIDDILRNPFLCDMPTGKDGERDTCLEWMFITSLARHITDERLNALIQFEQDNKENQLATECMNIIHYSRRFDQALQVIFLRMLVQQHKNILQCNELRNTILKNFKKVKELLDE